MVYKPGLTAPVSVKVKVCFLLLNTVECRAADDELRPLNEKKDGERKKRKKKDGKSPRFKLWVTGRSCYPSMHLDAY